MDRFFNIAGQCNPADHCMLPASARFPEVMRLVDDKTYFVLHAPKAAVSDDDDESRLKATLRVLAELVRRRIRRCPRER